jgi:hypothetical protein
MRARGVLRRPCSPLQATTPHPRERSSLKTSSNACSMAWQCTLMGALQLGVADAAAFPAPHSQQA